MLVQFFEVTLGGLPRVYVAKPREIAKQLKGQSDGRGNGNLQEDIKRISPKSQYSHRLPKKWEFSQVRLRKVAL